MRNRGARESDIEDWKHQLSSGIWKALDVDRAEKWLQDSELANL